MVFHASSEEWYTDLKGDISPVFHFIELCVIFVFITGMGTMGGMAPLQSGMGGMQGGMAGSFTLPAGMAAPRLPPPNMCKYFLFIFPKVT